MNKYIIIQLISFNFKDKDPSILKFTFLDKYFSILQFKIRHNWVKLWNSITYIADNIRISGTNWSHLWILWPWPE